MAINTSDSNQNIDQLKSLEKRKENLEDLVSNLENRISNYQQITESVQNTFWLVEADSQNPLYISGSFEQLYGSSVQDFYKDPNTRLQNIHPDNKLHLPKSLVDFNDKKEIEYDFRVIISNNEIWIKEKLYPIYDSSNNLIRVAGVSENITNLKKENIEVHSVKNQLEDIMEKTSAGLIILSSNLEIRYLNSSFQDILKLKESKLSADQLMDINVIDYLHDDYKELVAENARKRFQGDKVDSNYEIKGYNLLGEDLWLDFHASIINYNDEECVLCTTIDISSIKRAEQQILQNEAYLKSLLESPKDLIVFSLDTDLRYLTFNQNHQNTMKNIWGVDIEVGESMLEYISRDEDRSKAFRNFDRCLKGEEFSLIEEYGSEEYDRRYYEDSYSPIKLDSGEIIGLCVYVRDITDKISNQNELEKQKNELKELNKSKDKLFSIIAHDLKAPMFGFMGLTEMLNDSLSTMTISEMKEISENMHNSAKSIWTLLENLLEWSKANTGNIKFNPSYINVNLIANSVYALLEANAKQKGIDLINNIPEDSNLYADPNMINTIIRNLVNNAIKYTEHGEIKIYAQEENEFCTIVIEDTGIGIPENKTEDLFKIGKSDSLTGTHNETGTGIGLLVCKEFIDIHGGDIWAESQIGKGSKFKFKIRTTNPE